jgi:adenosylcobinamide-GDP ribazoletransferase
LRAVSIVANARAAFSYFSILPTAGAGAPDARMMAFLPLVGAVIGALAGTAGWALALAAPHVLAVAAAFGLSIVLSGALHVDGFLDACDALFATVPPERRLAILKDPDHGTYAIAYFAVLCAIWLGALWSIDPVRLPLGLAFAAAAARWIAVCIAFRVPYGAAGEQPSWRVHALMGLLVLGLGWSYWGHAVILVALGSLTFLAAHWIRSRLGGRITGDCYGFLIVCTEVAILAGLPLTSP